MGNEITKPLIWQRGKYLDESTGESFSPESLVPVGAPFMELNRVLESGKAYFNGADFYIKGKRGYGHWHGVSYLPVQPLTKIERTLDNNIWEDYFRNELILYGKSSNCSLKIKNLDKHFLLRSWFLRKGLTLVGWKDSVQWKKFYGGQNLDEKNRFEDYSSKEEIPKSEIFPIGLPLFLAINKEDVGLMLGRDDLGKWARFGQRFGSSLFQEDSSLEYLINGCIASILPMKVFPVKTNDEKRECFLDTLVQPCYLFWRKENE